VSTSISSGGHIAFGPEVLKALEAVKRQLARAGYDLAPDAAESVALLIAKGADLIPRSGVRRTVARLRGMENLRRFAAAMKRAAHGRGSKTIQGEDYARAHNSICPCYPFRE
jgi:hypothetical protein